MSLKAMIWAFEQKCKTPTEKLILIALSDIADDQGFFTLPDRPSLAEFCCTNEKVLKRGVKSLVLSGLIRLYAGHHPRLMLPLPRDPKSPAIQLATVDGKRVPL